MYNVFFLGTILNVAIDLGSVCACAYRFVDSLQIRIMANQIAIMPPILHMIPLGKQFQCERHVFCKLFNPKWELLMMQSANDRRNGMF